MDRIISGEKFQGELKRLPAKYPLTQRAKAIALERAGFVSNEGFPLRAAAIVEMIPATTELWVDYNNLAAKHPHHLTWDALQMAVR
jgi:hypothetical protein